MLIDYTFSVVIFLFGLVAGSFLNCVIYRLEAKDSFLKGRSFCPFCRHSLGWLDLIPVLSFVLLKGKCRYCQKPISFQYPLVEIVTGVLFFLVFYYSVSVYQMIYHLIAVSFLIIVFFYDLKHYIIPDKVIYPAIIIAFLFSLPLLMSDLSFVLSAFLAGGFFLAIVLITRGKGMGIGDIKLGFLMGLLLGWPHIVTALFLAFILGSVVGVLLILLGKKGLKSEVPFGPFLITGTFLALFWGDKILNWYLNCFLLK